jgi:hypothetical protein
MKTVDKIKNMILLTISIILLPITLSGTLIMSFGLSVIGLFAFLFGFKNSAKDYFSHIKYIFKF